jgi:hypothetical protein
MPETEVIIIGIRQILFYTGLGAFVIAVILLALLAARRNRRPRDDD